MSGRGLKSNKILVITCMWLDLFSPAGESLGCLRDERGWNLHRNTDGMLDTVGLQWLGAAP